MPSDKNPLTIAEATPEDFEQAVELVKSVFTEFVAPHFEQDGIDEFMKYAKSEKMRERVDGGNRVLVARSGPDIIGVAEMRDQSHLALLFVNPNFQKQGIGRALLKELTSLCRAQNPDLKQITVNSSLNAVNAYAKMGFSPTGKEKKINGIRFVPMEMLVE